MAALQQRNKPKEPPKVPEKAPFFLPTLPGVEARFAPEVKDQTKDAKNNTRRLEKAVHGMESVFAQKLVAEVVDGDCEPIFNLPHSQHVTVIHEDETFFKYAKTLSPAALELELRSLVTMDSLSLFINALTRRLLSHRDFEAVQALQNVFLRMHGDVLIVNPEMQHKLEELREVQRKESQKVLELIASSLGTLGFVRDTL